MWTSKNRVRYDRSKLRYPSDLTDDEWLLVEPLIPPGKTGGGKRTVIMREVVNGLMYILSTGCQWRAIPKDLPPKSSVYDYFDLWAYDGTLARIHHSLYERCREQAQREASPTAAIIDSQSVKSAEKGGAAQGVCCHLADAGVEAADIAAISGHMTLAMVQKYIAKRNREAGAIRAMTKLVEHRAAKAAGGTK